MSTNSSPGAKVKITKNGPYLVEGGLPLAKEIIGTGAHGESVKWVPGEEYPHQDRYALCRCGGSRNKPFCDGSHAAESFNDEEQP